MLAAALGLAGPACSGPDPVAVCGPKGSSGWGRPRPVRVERPDGGAFEGSVEEPEVVDFAGGRWLLFNDEASNDRKDLFLAREDADGGRFVVQDGPVGADANSDAVDGNPTADQDGQVYFVSSRGYPNPTETVFQARLEVDGASGRARLAEVRRAQGLSREGVPWVTMGVHLSRDGAWLFWDEAKFDKNPPSQSDVVASRRTDAGYARLPGPEQAALLGHVNSPAYLEYAEFLSPDGLELYFTRTAVDRLWLPRSVSCLMVARRADLSQPFGVPVGLWAAGPGPGVLLEAPALSPDGQLLYYHRRAKGDRDARLWALERE